MRRHRQVVLDLAAAGRPIVQIADDLGVSNQTIYGWRKQELIDTGQLPGVTRAELAGLAAACSVEADLIDKSLRAEREEARVEKRAAPHAELGAMLYGIAATPQAAPADSAVDTVMSRVHAYREIKNQIQADQAP